MSEDKNTCIICGGIMRIEYTIAFEQSRPREISVSSDGFPRLTRLCPGHFPEQDKLHDGKLDDLDDATVSLKDELYVKIEDKYEVIILSASQALSLLTWLLQTRRYLEKIAEKVESAKE